MSPVGPGAHRTPPSAALIRTLDRLTALLAIALATWFTLRTPAWGKFDPLRPGITPGIAYFAVAIVLALLLLVVGPLLRPGTRRACRVVSYTAVGLFLAMAVGRLALAREVLALDDPWPPRQALIDAVVLDSLGGEERVAWGVRVASHALLDAGEAKLPITLPPDWPFPADVAVAVDRIDSTEVDVWARSRDGLATCLTVWLDVNRQADSSTRRSRCADRDTPPAGLTFASPSRAPHPGVELPVAPPSPPWSQYRGDPQRSGHAAADRADDAGAGWRTWLDGRIRASASVAGDLVLVGGHGTGSLTALDRATGEARWIARLPNWIHQDPLTDGRIVVVGFGDNLPSFNARAPSGVAAYDLATGRHRWTAFDPGSVMTSPVLHDSALVYGTGSGLLRRRHIETGALLGEAMLPGFVTMAPPALVGDTVVFSLDHGAACALDVVSLEQFWCAMLPDLRMLGHAAPTIVNGTVLVSGVATIATVSPREFNRLGTGLQRRLLWSALFPGRYEVHAGQVVAALDLHDGTVRWRSPLFPFARQVVGHTSGTATAADGLAAVVLPVADTLVVFDPANGTVAWAKGAHQARGPPLVVDGHVIVAGRDGVITIRSLATGALECTVERAVGWDRGGPTLAGDLVVLANLVGLVEAVPLERLLECAYPADPSPT